MKIALAISLVALLVPATATGSGGARHGFRNTHAPRLIQRGLTRDTSMKHVLCLWEVPRRSVGCTMWVRGVPLSMLFEPFAPGLQRVTATNLNTYRVKFWRRDRCPAELRCY